MPKTKTRTPIWQAISATLRADISDGRYGLGDKLPTETALADRFGVHRHTVRHALSHLVDEGLVRTRRGSGAFVQATPTDYPIGRRVRFHESLAAAGRLPRRRILQIESRGAAKVEAEALQIAVGDPVCVCHGLSLADDRPIALCESHFPRDRLSGIDKILAEISSVTEALRRVGVTDYTRTSTRLTAVKADAGQALHLHVQEGDPLLFSAGINIDGAGVPVEYGRTWFAGDRVTLTLEE